MLFYVVRELAIDNLDCLLDWIYNFIMKENYTQASHYFPTIAFHIEITPLADRTYELIQEPDGGYFWSSGQHCRINWSPELWFGGTKVYWLHKHYYRQDPMRNPIF